jgi:hypothetical protein
MAHKRWHCAVPSAILVSLFPSFLLSIIDNIGPWEWAAANAEIA